MLKKKFLKNKCKVTFELPAPLAKEANEVYLVGDFNDWKKGKNKLEQKHGDRFDVIVELPLNQEFQFLYLIDDKYYSDWEADKYIPSPFSGDNSVVTTYVIR